MSSWPASSDDGSQGCFIHKVRLWKWGHVGWSSHVSERQSFRAQPFWGEVSGWQTALPRDFGAVISLGSLFPIHESFKKSSCWGWKVLVTAKCDGETGRSEKVMNYCCLTWWYLLVSFWLLGTIWYCYDYFNLYIDLINILRKWHLISIQRSHPLSYWLHKPWVKQTGTNLQSSLPCRATFLISLLSTCKLLHRWNIRCVECILLGGISKFKFPLGMMELIWHIWIPLLANNAIFCGIDGTLHVEGSNRGK